MIASIITHWRASWTAYRHAIPAEPGILQSLASLVVHMVIFFLGGVLLDCALWYVTHMQELSAFVWGFYLVVLHAYFIPQLMALFDHIKQRKIIYFLYAVSYHLLLASLFICLSYLCKVCGQSCSLVSISVIMFPFAACIRFAWCAMMYDRIDLTRSLGIGVKMVLRELPYLLALSILCLPFLLIRALAAYYGLVSGHWLLAYVTISTSTFLSVMLWVIWVRVYHHRKKQYI